MKLYISSHGLGEVIDVPAHVVEKRNDYRKRFLDWLYNPKVKHKYRVDSVDATGKKFIGLCYGAEAFVEWLNKKVLRNGKSAKVLETDLDTGPEAWEAAGLPYIFF